MPLRKLSTQVVGYVGERLVEVYAMLSSGGKLISFRPAADVDHKDLIFDERGRNRNVYVQVKCAHTVDASGFVHFRAAYPLGDIPSSDRFVYVLALLDVDRMALTDIWLVPSRDFNRLAARTGRRGGITLLAAPGIRGRSKWNRHRIQPQELGSRLLAIIQKAPAEEPLALPGSLLFVLK